MYGLFCNKEKCKKIYIGQTKRQIKERISEHKTSVRTKNKNVIGTYFNGPGHSLDNMEYTAVEKVYTKSESVLNKRESFWIREFEAEHQGLNDRK